MCLTNAKLSDIINKLICGDAGIGRQASLRCLCQYWRVGSSPISRTSVKDIRFSSVLFYISANQQISKALSSKKSTLESHEIFDLVEAELVPQHEIFDLVEAELVPQIDKGKPQVPQSVLACGFKSHFPHQCKGHSIFGCPLFLFIEDLKINSIKDSDNRIRVFR